MTAVASVVTAIHLGALSVKAGFLDLSSEASSSPAREGQAEQQHFAEYFECQPVEFDLCSNIKKKTLIRKLIQPV